MNPKLKNHFIYWILPSLFILLCAGVYFFNWFGLSFVIAPTVNREFGLLENTQLLLILAVIILAIRKVKFSSVKKERLLFTCIAAFSFFVFLEEVDYFLHVVDYIKGIPETDTEVRNLHNQGNLLHFIKLAVYISFVVILALLPLAKDFISRRIPALAYFIPSRWFILSLIAMVILNQWALYADKSMADAAAVSLNSNISEFEECFIYYIGLLYVRELTKKEMKF